MSLILVTGGVRSGKSKFAEEYVMREGKDPWLYFPTAYPTDQEMILRIDRHRKERDPRFRTLDPLAFASSFPDLLHCLEPYSPDSSVLLDGLGLLLSGMLEEQTDVPVENLVEKASSCLSFLMERNGLTVVVTEETGLGGIPMTPLGRRFADLLGEVNQMLASRADFVYMLVAGCVIPLRQHPSESL